MVALTGQGNDVILICHAMQSVYVNALSFLQVLEGPQSRYFCRSCLQIIESLKIVVYCPCRVLAQRPKPEEAP